MSHLAVLVPSPVTPTHSTLRTPGVIAQEIAAPLHRVLSVLRTCDHIPASVRSGRLRLYDQEAIAYIRHDVNALEARELERGDRGLGNG